MVQHLNGIRELDMRISRHLAWWGRLEAASSVPHSLHAHSMLVFASPYPTTRGAPRFRGRRYTSLRYVRYAL